MSTTERQVQTFLSQVCQCSSMEMSIETKISDKKVKVHPSRRISSSSLSLVPWLHNIPSVSAGRHQLALHPPSARLPVLRRSTKPPADRPTRQGLPRTGYTTPQYSSTFRRAGLATCGGRHEGVTRVTRVLLAAQSSAVLLAHLR